MNTMYDRRDSSGGGSLFLVLLHLTGVCSICAILCAVLLLTGAQIPILTLSSSEDSEEEELFTITEKLSPEEAAERRRALEESRRLAAASSDDSAQTSPGADPSAEESSPAGAAPWSYPGSIVIEDDDDEVTLTFAGDLLLDPYYATGSTVAEIGLAACFDEASLSVMRESDLFIVNNEFPYTDSQVPQENKLFTFHAPPSSAGQLLEIGTDLALLANNHMYDYRAVGVTDTVDALDQAGISHIGAGRNIAEASRAQIYTVQSSAAEPFTIGIINATQVEQYAVPNTLPATETDPGVFRCFDPSDLYRVIEETSSAVDFVIVCVHWGTEKEEAIQPLQAEQAAGMVSHGADLIIGGHPHILQPIEYVSGVPVVYSLGNYLFTSFTLDTGVVRAVLSPSSRSLSSLQFIPMLQNNCRVTTMAGSEKERVLNYIQNMSRGILIDSDGYIRPQ